MAAACLNLKRRWAVVLANTLVRFIAGQRNFGQLLAAQAKVNSEVAQLVDAIKQNTTNFMQKSGHKHSMLFGFDMLGPVLLWEWQLQNPQHSLRFVRLSTSDLFQLADVALTLQQYPRVSFVVYCEAATAREGSIARATLESVLRGKTQHLRLLVIPKVKC